LYPIVLQKIRTESNSPNRMNQPTTSFWTTTAAPPISTSTSTSTSALLVLYRMDPIDDDRVEFRQVSTPVLVSNGLYTIHSQASYHTSYSHTK
jgi:hypothetical protein